MCVPKWVNKFKRVQKKMTLFNSQGGSRGLGALEITF